MLDITTPKQQQEATHWLAPLTRQRWMPVRNPIKDYRCLLEQETSPTPLSNGWNQERVRLTFT